jgi:TolA-binding protein
MNRLPARYGIAALLALLLVVPSWGQKSGSHAPSPSPAQPGGSAPNAPGQPMGPSQPSGPQMQTPLYVNGRILMDTGQPVPEPVSVGLNCGMNSVQVIRTDLKGYFQFTLGAGPQGNASFSAADQTPIGAGMNGMNSPSGHGGYGAMGGLTGCELQISVAGYQPLINTITDPADLGRIEVGTLHLTRIAGARGSAISVTSLLVPNGARKEFDKGAQDARSNNLKSATQHLEKAVAEYDKYAAAWNELGNIYSANKETEKARQAFEKAVAADPQYIPPYVSLASLAIQNQEYESAVETAGKALELDPSVGVASFIQAIGNFRLNRLDAAEKSALDAQKGPHQTMPQVHAMLADIFLQKHDYSQAAAQMRAYLKEAPKGPFAADMKKDLEQIEKSAANDESKPASTVQPDIAP